MTEQELEEKIKEKIDEIMGNLIDLNEKYKGNIASNKPLFIALLFIVRQMAIVVQRASVCFNARDMARPNTFKLCSIPITFMPFALLPFFQAPKDMSPISRKDAYDFIEKVGKSFEAEDKILSLAEQIEKE